MVCAILSKFNFRPELFRSFWTKKYLVLFKAIVPKLLNYCKNNDILLCFCARGTVTCHIVYIEICAIAFEIILFYISVTYGLL